MKKTYSEKLKDPRWQKKRLEILSRDNFTCTKCGDDKSTLHVHHEAYRSGNPWEISSSLLRTLCELCHENTHRPIKVVYEERGPAIEITVDDLPPINYDPNFKNILDIPSIISWRCNQLMKYSSISPEEYQKTMVSAKFKQAEWVAYEKQLLQETCLKWNFKLTIEEVVYG